MIGKEVVLFHSLNSTHGIINTTELLQRKGIHVKATATANAQHTNRKFNNQK